jgi:hypothetical protein
MHWCKIEEGMAGFVNVKTDHRATTARFSSRETRGANNEDLQRGRLQRPLFFPQHGVARVADEPI